MARRSASFCRCLGRKRWFYFSISLEGLEYAHSMGVLHRDLKPDNVMAGPRGEVKIMDFGIAHVLGSVRQTREQSIVGTLQYICPELINSKEISARSDIYSLGILLFEMVSGKLPFAAENDFALLHQHLEKEPPLLSTVAPDVPSFLDDAIFKAMLHKAPEDRFASCREMADFPLASTHRRTCRQRRFSPTPVDRFGASIPCSMAAKWTWPRWLPAIQIRELLSGIEGSRRAKRCRGSATAAG